MPRASLSQLSSPRPYGSQEFTFYSQTGYFYDLSQRIAATNAGDRIALMSMGFEATAPRVTHLLHELYSAARRGVMVLVGIDAYNFIVGERIAPGPLFFGKQLPQKMPAFFQHNLEGLKELEASGGRYAIINMPSRRLTPSFKGRSHIKHAIINDRLYIGGCNLYNRRDIDIMVGWENAEVADWLYHITERIIETGNVRTALEGKDIRKRVDSTTELLIDAGRPGQSAIYKDALALIDEAVGSLYMTCQYLPNNPTMKHLQAAYVRGVPIDLYYNHPSKHQLPRSLPHYGLLWHARLRLPASLREKQLLKSQPFLHAKLISSDKSTMIGSHNYVKVGVDFGTAEIALLSHNPDFAQHAVKAINSQLV